MRTLLNSTLPAHHVRISTLHVSAQTSRPRVFGTEPSLLGKYHSGPRGSGIRPPPALWLLA
eukprot:2630603-Pleurochrysis_carterae.AAC.1